VLAHIDFEALRAAGLLETLGGSSVAQEPEYRRFVERTGFDYLTDLDSVLASFHPRGNYFVVRGRFDWRRLKQYVAQQSGNCYNFFCRVQGSTPERNISFFPIQPDVMALAVSPDDSAAQGMEERPDRAVPPVPRSPVWSYIPAAKFQSAHLPSGAQLFSSALAGAESILLTIGPERDRLEMRVDVACGSETQAARLAAELAGAMAHVRKALPADGGGALAGVLSSGALEHQGTHVLGRWPFDRSVLEALAGRPL
jgi:hypothetical protein